MKPENEFMEDRERQLPADVRRSGDVAGGADALTRMRDTPAGEPAMAYDVRSVYDSRPVNGTDFNITESVAIPSAESGGGEVSFIVPKGFVAVLRRIHHFFDPIPIVWDSRNDVLGSILLNGVRVPRNSDIPIGVSSDDIVYAFVIGDEGDSIGFEYTAALVTGVDITFFVHFYGQLLQKTDAPANYQIANRVRGVTEPPRVAPAPLVPPPAAPQAPAAQRSQPAQAVVPTVSVPQCPPGSVWDASLQRCMRPRGDLRLGRRK